MEDHARDSLEQELRDERARRRDSEQRLAEANGKVELWRTRAEERTERIDRLLAAQRKPTNRVRRWLGLGWGAEPVEPTAGTFQPEPREGNGRSPAPWPTQKSIVVVAAIADPGKRRALETFDLRDISSASDSDFDRADIVVYEPGTDPGAERLLAWARQAGRQPILLWGGGTVDPELAALAVARVSSDPDQATRQGLDFLPGCFDPVLHNPMAGAEPTHTLDRATIAQPGITTIEEAASGFGFDEAPGSNVVARRWAYRHHAPWVRADQIQRLVGLPARDLIPGLAALLVSHRPDDIPAALHRLAAQTLEPSEVVVIVHGSQTTTEIEGAASRCPFPVQIATAGNDLSLGACLNLAASKTTAPLLAKIDDDDHYGPGYLEDSFHTLCYSGADIVGKGAHYTYVEGVDETVLRHPGAEERFIDSSPNGATLVFARSIWEKVGFPHRPRHVDTGFLRAARLVGASVYAGNRWEFCYMRRTEGHTWDAEDEVFLAGSSPAWSGRHPARVELKDLDGA